MGRPDIRTDRGRRIRVTTREIGPNDADFSSILEPHSDIVVESVGSTSADTTTFAQHNGPFTTYERVVTRRTDGAAHETTTWSVDIPWFWWMFTPLISRHFARHERRAKSTWWAPPQELNQREVLVLSLLAAASMASAFINTLFTQTVTYAAEAFNVGEQGQGVAAAIVRFGIVVAIPIAVLGDRIGRRRIIVSLAWIAPVIAALGALAPSFWLLTANQTIARPLGLALDVALLVVAVEEMPKNARAYGLSILALASGLGAGIAVIALPLADAGENGWRIIYVVSLIWLVVAARLTRRLSETTRFTRHRSAGSHEGSRCGITRKTGNSTPRTLNVQGVILLVAFLGNVFLATASIFQNRYLKDVRGYSAVLVAAFTLLTTTPSALGLVFGGRLADVYGRRVVAATCIPVGALLIAMSFVFDGPLMWVCAVTGGVFAATAYPAMAVYRGELSPTAKRQTSSFLVTVSALLGGSAGLIVGGTLIDHHWSYGTVMLTFSSVSLVIAALVWFFYPETAHRELEELNPQDAP
ncbi:MAG: MFS transporter [Acidobacteria bacterium]|nr:MFS transporter [Acidobacteriota bacterium]